MDHLSPYHKKIVTWKWSFFVLFSTSSTKKPYWSDKNPCKPIFLWKSILWSFIWIQIWLLYQKIEGYRIFSHSWNTNAGRILNTLFLFIRMWNFGSRFETSYSFQFWAQKCFLFLGIPTACNILSFCQITLKYTKKGQNSHI